MGYNDSTYCSDLTVFGVRCIVCGSHCHDLPDSACDCGYMSGQCCGLTKHHDIGAECAFSSSPVS